ncbi:MAG: AraC family transcriptional regulator [Kordiimonadaceae bacterium]|nr:AraC family transcriptional regulator [Kordiimonadaceae bacterium]
MPETTIADIWEHTSSSVNTSVILPDGCRDLIVEVTDNSRLDCFVTDLFDTPFHTRSCVNSHMVGFRFKAGTTVDVVRLLNAVQKAETTSKTEIVALIEEFTSLSANLNDALISFKNAGQSVSAVAAGLGVELRSLQRLVYKQTGRSPVYWRQLARVRNAGRMLTESNELADVASLAGFSDQAHMTREFRRWFGVTPKVFLQNRSYKDQLGAIAY